MFQSRILCGLGLVLLLGCSESTTDDSSTGGTSTSSDGGTSTTSSSDGGSGASTASGAAGGSGAATSASGAAGGSGSTTLIINEISAVGDDYIEIYNPSSAAVDAGGLKIADSDSPGVPKIAGAITLPAGTTVAPGAYLFILADVMDAMPGSQTMCDPGPSPCFHAPWGLSKDGEEVFILSASDAILATEAFPATGVAMGETWGRLPNATGAFAVNAPTPGEPNEAP
jgi:hypothetical protein